MGGSFNGYSRYTCIIDRCEQVEVQFPVSYLNFPKGQHRRLIGILQIDIEIILYKNFFQTNIEHPLSSCCGWTTQSKIKFMMVRTDCIGAVGQWNSIIY